MARYASTLVAVAAFLFTTVALPAQGERKLELTFQDGRVRLIATNVTVREILGEWARKGGTQVINGDRMPGGPISVAFENATEDEVLESLLRSAAGYVLAPKTLVAGGSTFGVISILPSSQAVAAPTYGGSPTPAPVRTRPDDEIPPVTPPIAGQPVNPPVNTPPPPDTTNRPSGATGVPGVVPIIPVTPVAPSTPAPPPAGRGGTPPPSSGAGSF